MSTPVKILLGLAGVVLLLFLAVVIAVTVIFEPEDYRGYIVDAVEDATGRSFELQGELGLSVFPCCSVALGPSRLGNPPGFPDDRFASIEAAAASLEIWPLLVRREVAIGSVSLEGVDVSLVRLADGRVNWEFDAAAPAGAPAEAPEPATTAFEVEGITVSGGRIGYLDQQAGTSYTATDLALQTGSISYGRGEPAAFPFEAALTVTDDTSGARAQIGLEADVTLDGERITVTRPALNVEAAGDVIPGGTAKATVAADSLAASLGDDGELVVEALSANLEALASRFTLTGNGRTDLAATAATLGGTFVLEETSPRALLAAVTEEPFQPADTSALIRLAAEGRWSVTGSTLAVEDLAVQLDESRLTGSAAAEELGSGAVRFDLAVDGLDVDRYLPNEPEPASSASAGPLAPGNTPADRDAAAGAAAVVPLEVLAATDVDGKVHIGELRVSGITLDGIELGLASRGGQVTTSMAAGIPDGRISLAGEGDVTGAEPRLAGTLNLQDVSPRALLRALDAEPATADPGVLARLAGTARWSLGSRAAALDDVQWQLDRTRITGNVHVDDLETLAARFDLAVDSLNVDAYLAPEAAEAPEAEEAAEIPVELIRDLRLGGRLRAAELVMLDMTLRQVQGEVNAADGVLRLDPLTASLYGGDYRGSVVIDATGANANLTLAQKLTAVQVGDILKSFTDSDLLAGSLSVDLSGSGAGNTPAELLRGLAGNVSLDLSDGVYRGMDVLYELRRARALLKKEPAPAEPASKETAIRTLKASGSLVDGVLQTNRISADASGLQVTGQGGLNLVELALDYRLDAVLSQSAAAAARLGDLANLTIPLTIEGPVTGPRVGVDLKGLVTGALQQRARDALLDRLGGGKPAAEEDAGQAPAAEPGAAGQAAPTTEVEQPKEDKPSTRDLLKRGLRDLLGPKPDDEDEEPDG